MGSRDLLDWDWVQQHKSQSFPRLGCQQLADRRKTSPSDPVVGCGDRVLDVEEFTFRIAGVAARLRAEATDRPVVLLVDRSLSSTVGLMGVQWAGRCLVPLDVDDPPARLSSILDRIGDCTVADASGRGVRFVGSRSVIDVSDVTSEWIDPVAVRADSDGLIVFTSGSTGEPKGIVRTCWQDDSVLMRNRQLFSDQVRSAVTSPLNWLGGLSTFRAILEDGYMHIVDPMSMSASELVAYLAHLDIEALHGTPSLIESLARSDRAGRCIETLTLARVYGEPVHWSTVKAARSIGGPRMSLLALYGATEIAGAPGSIVIGPDEPLQTGPLPMGRFPADYVEFAPFDSVDSGVAEIVVHKWVSDRYWGDPIATSRVFGVDEAGHPVYRTGDLVEFDAAGNIWYVGRADDVVKISGRLVNPSEAAKVLAECAGVRQVVVLARTLESGKKSLVAHVAADPSVSPRILRERMVAALPPHLVPSVLMRHDELPLLPGGKVDRQRLSSMPVVSWRDAPVIGPRNGVESFVVREATALLGLDVLGVDDDLWSLGLDSLGAIELCEVLAQAMSPGMTVNDFIGASTPAAIADRIATAPRAERSHVVPLVEGDSTSVFIVTGGGGPALNVRELAKRIGGGRGVVAYEQWGLMQRSRPDRTIRAAAERNLDHLRTVNRSLRPVLIGHSWGGLVVHEMAIELRKEGLDPLVVLLDTGRPGHHRKHFDRPASLKVRVRPWPRYLARLFYWQFHRVLAPIWQWRRADRRYLSFLRHAARASRRHHLGIFSGEILVVQAEGSTVGDGWLFEPKLEVVSVPGDHNTILQPPYVDEVARHIVSFISE